ncbi:hypothetical protein M0804_015375 [Polistes exclamans]|nr:hypothetical protein M0804_015375 [Polistes exclamans]
MNGGMRKGEWGWDPVLVTKDKDITEEKGFLWSCRETITTSTVAGDTGTSTNGGWCWYWYWYRLCFEEHISLSLSLSFSFSSKSRPLSTASRPGGFADRAYSYGTNDVGGFGG